MTNSRTKGMIPVANKPILEYIIEALKEGGIQDIVLVVGYRSEKVMNHFGDGTDFGVKIEYIKQRKFLGTAQALSLTRESIDSDFLILPGDNIISSDGIKNLKNCNRDTALLVTTSNRPSKYGVVGLKGDQVYKLVEKPKVTGDLMSTGVPSIFSLALWEYQEESISNIISTGACRLQPYVFDIIDEAASMSRYKLTDVLQMMIESGDKVYAYETKLWIDAVYPWDLLEMNSKILSKTTGGKGGKIEKGSTILGPISVGDDTIIKAGAYIQGPVVIGEGCTIGPNVVINPSTSIGNNVAIEPFTLINNSMIMDHVTIKSHSRISNSVIAEGVNVGANLITDTSPSNIQLVDYQHNKELGAIIGEDSVIGHNVVINSGVIIGSDVEIRSQKTIDKNLENQTKVM